jgi:hypothetical protein
MSFMPLFAESMSYRDFHVSIQALCERERSNSRSLETYLLALLRQAAAHARRESVTLVDLRDLLTSSFRERPYPFDDRWRVSPIQLDPAPTWFAHWRARLVRQIVDLHEFAEAGVLDDDRCYFGVQAARGSPWCNLDPVTYVACAMAGSFGDPSPEDRADWHFADCPIPASRSTYPLVVLAHPIARTWNAAPALSWAEFEQFIRCGQCHG